MAKLRKTPEAVRNAVFYENPQAYVTEQYHRNSIFPVLLTDGADECCKELGCYWVAEIIGSIAPYLMQSDQQFCVARTIIDDKGGAKFWLDDGDYNILYTQDVPMTTLKANLQWYVQPTRLQGKSYMVIMLPSEY